MDTCTYHSRNEAEYVCNHCRKRICGSCTILVEGEPFCQICWDGIACQTAAARRENPGLASGIPWQNRHELGLFRAFWDTAKMVSFQPGRFFSNLSTAGDFGAPILFAVICILLFWFPLNVFYIKFIFPALLNTMISSAPATADGETVRAVIPFSQELQHRFASLTRMDLLRMPLDYLVSYILIASLFQQALVTLFRGRQGYSATLQIRCYALTVQCLLLIPFLGIFLAELFSLILCAKGFRVAQQLPLPHALLVAAIPAMISLAATVFTL